MSYLTTRAVNHQQRVLSLYRKAIREMRNYYWPDHAAYLENWAMMRARFDQHKSERDFREAKKLLIAGEKELDGMKHPQPFQFAFSPGGVCFERDPQVSDWVLDMWHPLEKDQYPAYFARREQRKKEFIERWEKKYGPAHHHFHF